MKNGIDWVKSRLTNWLFHCFALVDEPFYGWLNGLANVYLLWKNPERVTHPGGLHPDKTFYVIRDLPPSVGLAGWHDRVLGYLIRAERKGWIPVIDPPPPAQADSGNWYDFFRAASPYSVEEALNSRNVVIASVRAAIYKRYNRKNIARRHRLLSKIPLSDEARIFVEKRLEHLFADMPDTVVAVRFRGTDYRASGSYCPTGHAKVPREEAFCDELENDMRRWGVPIGMGEHIFLVTEEQESLDKIRERFPKCRFVEKERFANFKAGKYLVYQRLPTLTPRENDFLYLLEIFALSRCDYLFGGVNGGVLMALNLNGNRYRGVHVIKTGVN